MFDRRYCPVLLVNQFQFEIFIYLFKKETLRMIMNKWSTINKQ